MTEFSDTKSSSTPPGLTYKDAGVDITAGDELVERIKPHVRRTTRPEVLGGLGGFGALFELPLDRYRHPVLVSGTDGVGTKLKLAIETGIHDTVGIDLVAMCVNDLIVQGAEPLFFLDYYATGRLDVDVAEQVIQGICQGCLLAGASLVGGETAEMPGFYAAKDYDLAGFCVGIVEKDAIIDGRDVQSGDCLIGLASSGAHSNGYSLIRKILEQSKVDLSMQMGAHTLAAALLAPTRIYVKPILELIKQVPVKAIAHITGGGIPGNLPRVLPESVTGIVYADRWPRPELFRWLQTAGRISDAEMWSTFNCGIGLIVCVAESVREQTLELLRQHGESPFVIGEIVARQGADSVRMV